jgi:TatD DNase family protein
MLIDTHCHLTHDRFAGDLPQVIAAAQAVGVDQMLTIGTSIADGEQAAELHRQHPSTIWCSVGLDPFACHAAGADFPRELVRLEALLRQGDFCALGEIGLEYHHPLAAHSDQRVHLEAQLELARQLRLPVILHVRDAHEDMLDCLRLQHGSRGVVHSFDGTALHARAYLDLGWHLAFNGMVTFKPKDYLREAARLVPNDRMLVETDSPYLAPVPRRGSRCEPAFVVHTLQALAELRGQRPEDLGAWTSRTARLLFALPEAAPRA